VNGAKIINIFKLYLPTDLPLSKMGNESIPDITFEFVSDLQLDPE